MIFNFLVATFKKGDKNQMELILIPCMYVYVCSIIISICSHYEKTIEMFYIVFGTKSLQSGMYFTLTAATFQVSSIHTWQVAPYWTVDVEVQ